MCRRDIDGTDPIVLGISGFPHPLIEKPIKFYLHKQFVLNVSKVFIFICLRKNVRQANVCGPFIYCQSDIYIYNPELSTLTIDFAKDANIIFFMD